MAHKENKKAIRLDYDIETIMIEHHQTTDQIIRCS